MIRRSRIVELSEKERSAGSHRGNKRMWTPGGFHRPLEARHREWKTETGKANFIVPKQLIEDLSKPEETYVLQLFTLRSNDQFNTTVYSYDDRYRGVYGTRKVLLMHKDDMARRQLSDGDCVLVTTVSDDQVKRALDGLRAAAYDVSRGCCAGYYPECNPLIPWWHHAVGSKTPAAKSIPVRVQRSNGAPNRILA